MTPGVHRLFCVWFSTAKFRNSKETRVGTPSKEPRRIAFDSKKNIVILISGDTDMPLPPSTADIEWPNDLVPFAHEDTDIQAAPHGHWAFMRENCPVLRVPAEGAELYYVARYDDVADGLRNHRLFSSSTVDPAIFPDPILMDPPDHSRVRTVVARHLSPKRICELEDQLRERSRGILKNSMGVGATDVVDDIAVPLTLRTIAQLLGVPDDDVPQLQQWSVDYQDYLGVVARNVSEREGAVAGARAFLEFVRFNVESPTAASQGAIVHVLAEAARAGKLSDLEVMHLGALLFQAGHDTTTILIAALMQEIVVSPEILVRLTDDPTLIPGFVEEGVRFACAPQRVARVSTEETEIAGYTIPKGAHMRFLIGSANRDPRRFPDGDRFIMDRDAKGHLGFGHGRHSCLGLWLARLEARVLFEELTSFVSQVGFNDASEVEHYRGGSRSITGLTHYEVFLKPRASELSQA